MRTPTLSSSGQPETQPLDGKSAPVNSDDSAHDDHNEPCRQEQGRTPPERPRIHTNMKEAADRSTDESLQELGTIPNSPGETRQVGVRQEDNLPDNTMVLSATGPEAPPTPNDDAMKQERRHSKGYAKSANASRNTHSQILLVGDGNVPRIARALQRQLGAKQNLQTCWTQHATAKRAQELLHQCIGEPQGEAGRCRRLVVLLVGATDAIRGTRPVDVVQVIRDSVALYAERLVICSVPEVTTRGKVTLARAITLNAQLRKMCSILRATFLDNSKQLEEGWLGRDSALYVADTASQVATRLATMANNFLGNRQGPRRRAKRGPKRKKENDTDTTGHGSPGGLTPTALDVCGQGSEGHPAQPQTQHPCFSGIHNPHHQTPTGADGPPENRALGQSVPCGATIPGDAIKRRDTTSCPAPAVPALAGQHTDSIPNPTDGSTAYWTRPGSNDSRHGPALHEAITFADDIVLMAESTEEMQALLDIFQDEITRLGLCFNVKKTALLRLVGECIKERVVTLGDAEVSSCTEYRYLGVKLSASTDMYSLHEAKTREYGLRAQSILRRRCLWGCNRYLMVRDLWKLVHVPGLTFANAVVLMSAATREWLERRQWEVGRIALGCHGMVANEAVQGDIGWSSFEAREAASKLTFHCRLMYMSRERWSRRVFDYLMATCMRTKWVRRVYQLEKKFGFFQEPLTAENQRGRTKEIHPNVLRRPRRRSGGRHK
ncbi:hypothetical protein HPB51_000670 [Rhipicephalus microplus]|uniref:Reverse transcriptase domain-containing protein n=1 Tax=Rhipicephalus microplus TaxID=6941 RepID=A0A9J6DEE4_RHIMP|nr:hypothetical protein HPB51_000670 [Rhipicephalus microplus]